MRAKTISDVLALSALVAYLVCVVLFFKAPAASSALSLRAKMIGMALSGGAMCMTFKSVGSYVMDAKANVDERKLFQGFLYVALAFSGTIISLFFGFK